MREKQLTLPPPTMSVTAVIPAFNEAESIAKTIKSLQDQTYTLAEIIIVDDCSTDGTGDLARQTGVTVVRTSRNQGTKAQAQNYGLQFVKTELFLTVDADTILREDALYEALRFYNDSNTEVVCGTVVPQRLETFWELGRLTDYLYAQAIMKPAQDHNGLVLVASGCFSLFKTRTAEYYGGFDERTMAEDMDLTWRIHEDGGRVYFANKAVCFPLDPPTAAIYFNQMDRWYRGFLQNMKVRRFYPFPKKRSLQIMVYIYLVWFAISALIMPLFFYALTTSILATIALMLVVNAVMVWTPAMIMGLRLRIKWWKILQGFLPYLVIPYVNMYIYIRSLWREVILNKPLTSWNKGH